MSDDNRLRYDLLSEDAQRELVAVLSSETINNPGDWILVDDAKEKYYALLQRHLAEWRHGVIQDPETTLLHLAHAAYCLHLLLALPPHVPISSFEERFNHAMKKAHES